jgi:hypothetical protein
MRYRRFDWHQHITDVWGEYRSARVAVDRLKDAVAATPDILKITLSILHSAPIPFHPLIGVHPCPSVG